MLENLNREDKIKLISHIEKNHSGPKTISNMSRNYHKSEQTKPDEDKVVNFDKYSMSKYQEDLTKNFFDCLGNKEKTVSFKGPYIQL